MLADEIKQSISDLKGKTIKLRLVVEADSEFILSLRLDPQYNQHLSNVSDDLGQQRDWICRYKTIEASGKEFYFIIERLNGTQCGTVRVYDIQQDSFSWGSWILNENKSQSAAIETALLIYNFGFNVLGFNKSHFKVLKDNCKVISFHTRFGAEIISEDENNIYFIFHKTNHLKNIQEFRQYLS